MRVPFRCVSAGLFGLLGLSLSAASLRAQPPDGVIPGEWIVTLNRSTNPTAQASGLAQAAGGEAGHVYTAVLNGFLFRGSDQGASALSRNPLVRTIVPNRLVQETAQTLPAGIRRIDASHPSAPDAHDTGWTGSGVAIAILDTGIDLDHPDLFPRIDVSLAKNCIGSGLPDDDRGHGTHVAGTVAATDNADGVLGVASGATLVPVKVLDAAGNGSWASVICGIDHVTANALEIGVANMSLGGAGTVTGCNDGGLHQAICESVAAGVVYVVSAGNSAANASNFVPAAYPEVLTVSAIADYNGEPGGTGGCLLFPGSGRQCDDTFAKFSNYGSSVDVTAPGVQVYSTLPNGTYGNNTGTSMASPHVAGVVALVRQRNPGLSPVEIEGLLKSTGECPNAATNSGGGDCAGQGTWTNDPDGTPEPLVNALAAVQGAAGGGGGEENEPPTASNQSIVLNEDQSIAWIPAVTDPDADALSCSLVAGSGPAHGSVQFEGDCSTANFVPVDNYNGTDQFTYRVTDGLASDTATVSVTVNAVNDAPVATNDSYSMTSVNTSLTVPPPGVLGNDTDVDLQSLTASLVTNVSNGQLALAADGSFAYQPGGFVGTTSFSYVASDGTAQSNVATVTISVTGTTATSMHVHALAGSSSNAGSSWTALVTITVRNNIGTVVSGATVGGHWNSSASNSSSCVTNTAGTCTVTLTGTPKRTGSVTFFVDSLSGGGLSYDSGANVVSSLVVSKP